MTEFSRDQARSAGIRALTAVLSDHCTLEEALARADASDAGELGGWLQDIAAGTLRWKGRLDLAIDSVALKKKPTGWLRKALLIAAYQLIAQERAVAGVVVSETVDLVRQREGEAPARFANALLRKVAEHAPAWRELAEDSAAAEGEAAARASLPPWLWRALERDHGREWAWSYARASLERPVTWIRARDAAWRPSGEGATAGPVPGAWRLPGGSGAIPSLAGFSEGAFIVQDVSSQLLIANVAAEIRSALGGERKISALDLCAAPGGKSVGLQWSGFDVSATDQSAARMALLRETLKRVRLDGAIPIVARGEIAGLPAQDLVWVDAPCSGSGILRRHPEVRWNRQEKDLAGLQTVQAELLQEGWAKVRPGGMLAYSVCSVLKDEGVRQVERLGAAKLREWLLAPQDAPYGDGFWAALLTKPS